jgi:hypothetical protein
LTFSDHVLEYLAQREIEAVIPPKANRVEQREYDRHVYKDRNLGFGEQRNSQPT